MVSGISQLKIISSVFVLVCIGTESYAVTVDQFYTNLGLTVETLMVDQRSEKAFKRHALS